MHRYGTAAPARVEPQCIAVSRAPNSGMRNIGVDGAAGGNCPIRVDEGALRVPVWLAPHQ